MTNSIQKQSLFNHSKLFNRKRYPSRLFQVVVNTEEDGSYEYEVEADTFAEATGIAEEMAYSLSVDILYIEVYSFE